MTHVLDLQLVTSDSENASLDFCPSTPSLIICCDESTVSVTLCP